MARRIAVCTVVAHARRKFHELWVKHQSKVGEQVLKFFQALYDGERDAADLGIDDQRELRLERGKRVADALKQSLDEHPQKAPDGSMLFLFSGPEVLGENPP